MFWNDADIFGVLFFFHKSGDIILNNSKILESMIVHESSMKKKYWQINFLFFLILKVWFTLQC